MLAVAPLYSSVGNTLILASYAFVSWLFLDLEDNVKKLKDEVKQKEKRIRELEEMMERL
jgi:hypothetical protein